MMQNIIAILFSIFLSLLETFAYHQEGIFSIIASRIWIIWTLYYLLVILYFIGKLFAKDIAQRKLLGITVLLFTTFLVTVNLTSFPSEISGESTQQVAAALENIKKKDLAYTKTAFLGYPSRQYLLVAWPSLIFGRTIFAYRLGYITTFIIGISLFYVGLKTFYLKYSSINWLAGLAVLASISFPVVPILLRTFEQVTLPLSFALQAVGFFLIMAKKPRFFLLPAFAWIITMLATTYTPALAVWVFFTLISLRLAGKAIIKKNTTSLIIWSAIVIISFSFGVSALQFRQDVRLIKTDNFQISQLRNKLAETFAYFFIKNTSMYGHQLPFIGYLMFSPIIIYLTGSLLYLFGAKHFLLVLWVISTIAISGISLGYAKPDVSFGIHRSMAVLPIILFAMIDILRKNNFRLGKKIISLLFIVLTLYNTVISYSIYKRWQGNLDISSLTLRETITTAKKLYIENDAPIQFGTFTNNKKDVALFHDHLKYFFPNSRLFDSNKCPHIDSNKPLFFYIETTHPCYRQILNQLVGKNYYLQEIKYQKELVKNLDQKVDNIQKIIIK